MTPRTRNRNNLIVRNVEWITDRSDYGGPWYQTRAPATYTSPGFVEIIQDETGPEFRRAQRARTFCVRNVSHEKSSIIHTTRVAETNDGLTTSGGAYATRCKYHQESEVSSVYDTVPWGTYKAMLANTSRDDTIGIPCPEKLGVGYLEQLMLQKAYAKASEADYQTYVGAAESLKTIESAERLITALPRLGQWLRKNGSKVLTGRGVIRASGTLARQWLEYRYGFMQLYYDATSLWRVVNRGASKYRTHVASCTLSDARVYLDQEVRVSSVYSTMLHRFGSRKDTVRAGVVVAVRPYHDITRSLGLHQPLTSLWELVPLSFIFDWFVDMSAVLGGLEGHMFLQPVASWTSHKLEWSSTDHFTGLGNSVPWNGGVWYSAGQYVLTSNEHYVRYVRKAQPGFRITAPPVRSNLNLKRLLDLSSMLRQLRQDAL